ncbi:hypothetical protein BL254_17210 [Protofrankia sp. BMG5.30]|uniref:Uncharacterized protein n=1 Tax=Protofrankia coriariae TaxID=1562887 RepID=A0ABR5F547_9ACTN|nr:hypothetical protein FrCorBMG51_08525 [Protofrankia coriariae]ONH34258.1 hypothetical protein BL254_17210 [Protofrankia sp. BMG5.30]
MCDGLGVVDGASCPTCFPRARTAERGARKSPKAVTIPTSVKELKNLIGKKRIDKTKSKDGMTTRDRLTGRETVTLTPAQRRELARRQAAAKKRGRR